MSAPDAMPDMEALGLLVAVAESGSLGRAAAARGVSQPAVSLRIRSLERRLGLVLLERSPTGSRLTPAGRAVVDWARPLLAAAETFTRGVTALADSHRDRLRVAASLTVADHLVPGWLVTLHSALPEVAVALRVGNSEVVRELVESAEVDLGYVEGPRAPRGLRSRVVGGDELVVVVAPGHPWTRRRRPLTPPELARVPLVLREPGSGTREALEQALAEHQLTVRTVLQLASTTAIRAAVAAGEGPAVLSRLAVSADLASRQLVAVPITGLDLRRSFRGVWRTGPAPAGPANTLLAISLRHPPSDVPREKPDVPREKHGSRPPRT